MDLLKSHATIWLALASSFDLKCTSLSRAERLILNQKETLYITLPQIGKAVDKSLSSGRLLLSSGLIKRKNNTELPLFMYELFSQFYHNNGYIRDGGDPSVLRKIRTLLYLFYKYEREPSEDSLATAAEKFILTDDSVKTDFSDCPISFLQSIIKDLCLPDPMDIKGRHSNGATADSASNLDKRQKWRFIPSLNNVYDPSFFFNTKADFLHYIRNNTITCPTEPSSKVAFVPKDSRGPRTICMEPHERMFIQQGYMHSLYEWIEHHSAAKGRINFTNQEVNRRLAYRASIDQSYATIDLKDASDLVSWELVKQVFPKEYIPAFEAMRTPTATLPDGRIVRLKKFAPMGSALCFPIEAIVFYAIAKLTTDDVYVYGDDIIVPTACVHKVLGDLELFGLSVNFDKTLYEGYFRESCGFDAYKGYEITPIRYRRDALDTFCAFANHISLAFGYRVADAVTSAYESFVHYVPRLPLSYSSTGVLALFGERDHSMIMFKRRYNKPLQKYELRLPIMKVVERCYECGCSRRELFDWYTNSYPTNTPIYSDQFENQIDHITRLDHLSDRCTILSQDSFIKGSDEKVRVAYLPKGKKYAYAWVTELGG